MTNKEIQTDEFNDFINNLAYYSADLNPYIKQHLAEKALEIYKDKIIVWMLSEFCKLDLKVRITIANHFRGVFEGEKMPLQEDYHKIHAEAYKMVIADLIYLKWWKEHADEYR